jgi:hypothetical protein
MLLMKKRFFDAIRSGRKTTTLRFWKTCRVRPGSAHTVPGLGKIHVEAVSEVDLRELRDEDARRDGFSSVRELRAELRKMYPQAHRAGRKLYLLRFSLVNK